MANNEQKTITISTIPIPKLTLVMNNFITNTVNHLNKLSVKGDEKLAEFDKKLNDLEIMTTLLEAKLNSLPEKITSTYPPLEKLDLDDITPVISSPVPVDNGPGNGDPIPPPPPPQDQKNQDGEDKKMKILNNSQLKIKLKEREKEVVKNYLLRMHLKISLKLMKNIEI